MSEPEAVASATGAVRASAASETVYDNRSESGGLDLFDPQGLASGVVNING